MKMGTLSPCPWDLTLWARMAGSDGAVLNAPPFRPLIGAPGASLRCRTLRSGKVSIEERWALREILRENSLPRGSWVG